MELDFSWNQQESEENPLKIGPNGMEENQVVRFPRVKRRSQKYPPLNLHGIFITFSRQTKHLRANFLEALVGELFVGYSNSYC